jgi:hypothetical protein
VIGSSARGIAKNTVAACVDAEVVGDLQGYVVEFWSFLPWLEPHCLSNSRRPLSARLIG